MAYSIFAHHIYSTIWTQSYWPVFLWAIILMVVMCYHNFLAKGIAGSRFIISGYDMPASWAWLKWISMAGFVPMAIVSKYLAIQTIVNALFGLLTVTTFWGSWKIFKSSVFSVTLTMGLLVNSLQYHIYVHNTVALILLLIYCQINLVCLVLFLRGQNPNGYLTGFFVSLALASQVWPTWLSYLSGLMLILLLLAIVYFRRGDKRRLRAVVILGAVSFLWGVLYAAVYLQLNPTMHLPKSGSHEDEMILVYGHVINMIEDFVSNAAAYLYVSLTYFLPWPLTWSNSLVLLSPDQYSNSSSFVGHGTGVTHDLHLRFLWRYVGGGLLAGYIFALVGLGKRILNSSRSDNYIYPAAFLLMIGAGSATHLLIKYRQISYIAGNEYKYMFSAWGAIMLISFLLMGGLKKVSNLGLRMELALTALSLIIYSAGFAHPYLHIIHQLDTFTRASLRPDPMRALLSILGFH